jgi:signal transduction histidine kinase
VAQRRSSDPAARGFGHGCDLDGAPDLVLTRAVPALLVVTELAGLTGWLVAGRILRPIRTIAGTANRLSAENLSERIPVLRPADELAMLAATINGMLDRIQRGITERDRVLNSQLLRVVNTGPLVTPEEGRRLFEPFVRGAGNGTRGAGLGCPSSSRSSPRTTERSPASPGRPALRPRCGPGSTTARGRRPR